MQRFTIASTVKCLFVLGIVSMSGNDLLAQDSHYSINQFGTRSALMGGAVVGQSSDNTVVYYNPGGLGFIDSATISINASVYQVQNIKVEDAVGRTKDFKGSEIGSFPLLIGGMLKSKNPKLKFGYGLVSPVHFNFDATGRIDNMSQIVDDAESPGAEEFIGQGSITVRLSEITGIFALGYRLSENWSVGLANMFAVRSHSLVRTNYSRFFINQPDLPLVSASFSRTAKYWNARYIPKLGINYRKDRLGLGLTFTAPSLSFMGNGSIAADVIGNNILYEGIRTDVLANDRQEKIKSKYKSPWSLALGANYDMKRSSLGLSLQYHGAQKLYHILEAKAASFIRPASLYTELGSQDFLRFNDMAKAVFNFAIAYEYKLDAKHNLYASFRTDRSYFDDDIRQEAGINSQFTSWDIYHLNLGATFIRNRSQISVGLLLSGGNDDSHVENGNLENPSENNFLQGTPIITRAKYNSIGLLLGYTFLFNKLD